jgi:hypothetical protein
MRDAVIQRTMGQNADLDWQAWRPAIVYINGVYNGIAQHIRERSNEDNIYTNYNGLEDIDMVENWTELKTLETWTTSTSSPRSTTSTVTPWLNTKNGWTATSTSI